MYESLTYTFNLLLRYCITKLNNIIIKNLNNFVKKIKISIKK